MILQQESDNVVQSGILANRAGVIKEENLGILYEILRKSIYSRPLEAVVREISTNAADAHIAVGTPSRPFEVSINSTDNPSITFRDFGPGLSEEQILDDYQSLGASSKRNSNEFNGCFGLGSKSPHAISNMYSVTSIQNGIKKIFTCYKDGALPFCSKLHESITDEEQGLIVTVPLAKEYLAGINAVLHTVYAAFTIRPLVNGKPFEPIHEILKLLPNQSFTDAECLLNTHSIVVSYHRSYILMQNVLYPIEPKHFDTDLHSKMRTRCAKENITFYNNGVHFIIKAPNGAVNYVASREELRYDDKTLSYLKTEQDLIMATFERGVAEVAKTYPTPWSRTIYVCNARCKSSLKDTIFPGQYLGADYFTFTSMTYFHKPFHFRKLDNKSSYSPNAQSCIFTWTDPKTKRTGAYRIRNYFDSCGLSHSTPHILIEAAELSHMPSDLKGITIVDLDSISPLSIKTTSAVPKRRNTKKEHSLTIPWQLGQRLNTDKILVNRDDIKFYIVAPSAALAAEIVGRINGLKQLMHFPYEGMPLIKDFFGSEQLLIHFISETHLTQGMRKQAKDFIPLWESYEIALKTFLEQSGRSFDWTRLRLYTCTTSPEIIVVSALLTEPQMFKSLAVKDPMFERLYNCCYLNEHNSSFLQRLGLGQQIELDKIIDFSQLFLKYPYLDTLAFMLKNKHEFNQADQANIVKRFWSYLN